MPVYSTYKLFTADALMCFYMGNAKSFYRSATV